MSTLTDFYHDSFLPAQDLEPRQKKQFRNAINHARLMLGRPIEFIDIAQPSFRKQFIYSMRQGGATLSRAESLARCLRLLLEAHRAHKQAASQESNLIDAAIEFVSDFRGTFAAMAVSIIDGDDEVCAHAVAQLETLQAHIDSANEPEIQKTKP